MSSSSRAPNVRFAKTLLVGATGIFRDVQRFLTFQDAFDYIAALPSGQQPADDYRYIIRAHPDIRPERLWVPDFVWVEGAGSRELVISGTNTLGSILVSIGIGGMSNALIVAGGANAPSLGILLRNSSAVFTGPIAAAVNGTL